MRELGFSSRNVRTMRLEQTRETFVQECADFIENVRQQIRNGLSLNRLCAIDQTSFWNSPTHLRSHAPIGW